MNRNKYRGKFLYHLNRAEVRAEQVAEYEDWAKQEAETILSTDKDALDEDVWRRMVRKEVNNLLKDDVLYKSRVGSRSYHMAMVQMYGMALLNRVVDLE
jgi:hypothetical protein